MSGGPLLRAKAAQVLCGELVHGKRPEQLAIGVDRSLVLNVLHEGIENSIAGWQQVCVGRTKGAPRALPGRNENLPVQPVRTAALAELIQPDFGHLFQEFEHTAFRLQLRDG